MKRFLMATVVTVAGTTAAMAGGLDRSRLGYGILFEDGNRAELSFSYVAPTVTGNYPGGFGGGSTGDMAGDYLSFSLAYKQQLSDKLHLGVFVNTPFGANASYSQGPYAGLKADWKSQQIAGVLRYEATPAISVYGGLRFVHSEATISLPAALVLAPYTAKGSTGDLGYLVGVAFEKPEIALRVALTYESAVKHSFPTTETWAVLGGSVNTNTDITMPQSLALDFQTGIAKDTLLFGMVRWAEWSTWEVRPDGYGAVVNDSITGFDNDVMTYQLGIGRRLNDTWSVFARATYEKANGGVASRLAPTDGSKSFGLGGTYTNDGMKITGGIEYVKLGDAVDGSGVQFNGNDALGLGISVGYQF